MLGRPQGTAGLRTTRRMRLGWGSRRQGVSGRWGQPNGEGRAVQIRLPLQPLPQPLPQPPPHQPLPQPFPPSSHPAPTPLCLLFSAPTWLLGAPPSSLSPQVSNPNAFFSALSPNLSSFSSCVLGRPHLQSYRSASFQTLLSHTLMLIKCKVCSPSRQC